MRNRQLSVSALVRYLKGKLDQDPLIQRVIVAGEISNFTAHRSGHWYFTLKDEKSRISCVMFASNAARCKFIPKEGDSVLVQANTSIFEASGQLQLYVTAMKPTGLGDLYLKYEELKRRLHEEGLFDSEKNVATVSNADCRDHWEKHRGAPRRCYNAGPALADCPSERNSRIGSGRRRGRTDLCGAAAGGYVRL